MPLALPAGTLLYAVADLPIAVVPTVRGPAALNCAFDPPRPLGDGYVLKDEYRIDEAEFARLRRVYLSAQRSWEPGARPVTSPGVWAN